MTIKEFDIQFDILYNNSTSNQAPPLNFYEKSVFLTKSQETLVQSLYKGLNGEPFESTESSSQMLKSLLRNKEIELTKPQNVKRNIIKYVTTQPEDLLYVTLEEAKYKEPKCEYEPYSLVKSCKQNDLLDTLNNPFKGPLDKVLKVYTSKSTVSLFSSVELEEYRIQYIKKPLPIILEDLPDGITIDGHSKKSIECELHPYVHTQILAQAVQLAKDVWVTQNDEPTGYGQQPQG